MEFVGVVLAGGMSTRMGLDKAELTLDGQSMLHMTQEHLLGAGAKEVILNRNRFETGCLPDIFPHKGPLSGIHAAAFATPNSDILCVPVDMPLLTADTLRQLAVTGSEHRCSVLYRGFCLPLYLHNTPETRAILESLLCEGEDYSVRHFLSLHNHMEIVAETEQSLFNSNTQLQWQQVKQFLSEG